MQPSLVLVEHNRWNDQADEEGPHDSGSQAGRAAFDVLDLHAECPMPHAVTKCSHQQHLLQCEDAQRGRTVVFEECGRDQAAQHPVNCQSAQPAAGTRNGPGSRTRPAQSLARPVTVAPGGRTLQP